MMKKCIVCEREVKRIVKKLCLNCYYKQDRFKETRREIQKKWRRINRDKARIQAKEQRKRHYEKNKEVIKLKNSVYYRINRDKRKKKDQRGIMKKEKEVNNILRDTYLQKIPKSNSKLKRQNDILTKEINKLKELL